MDATFTPSLLPNPPIINSSQDILMVEASLSYKDIVVGKILTPNFYSRSTESNKDKAPETAGNQILLSEEDKQHMYAPWSHSFIIKLVKSNFNHQYLKKNRGSIKLFKSDSQSSVLRGGPLVHSW